MRRWLILGAGIAATILDGAGFLFYRAEQGHRLMHAAFSGRDTPIREALARDPNDAALWELLGEACASQSRYADAVEAYDRSIALDPRDETAWWMKGIAEVCRGNKPGVDAVEARLRQLNGDSAAQFRQIAPNGCSAFGSGPKSKTPTPSEGNRG
jgi:hypothetical protein